ncbi:MAG: ClpXP protease specificity-enhancing factor SspB [Acetobacterales bacterium]
MSESVLPYDRMVEEALRGVVRRALRHVAVRGLPGEHHFYVTFDTGAPGVEVSDRLRAQYPAEMTIVLQHQFWDLAVDDNGFQVGLSFQAVPETVRVPFGAITTFVDPSVNFGLQFRQEEGEEDVLPQATTSRKAGANMPVPQEPAPAPAAPEATADEPVQGADVVNLDSFRKK